MDFSVLRKQMVAEQLVSRGIKDERVLKVFSSLPREKFILSESVASAYADFPLPIGQGQTISQPYIVALMTELLALSGSEKVLEIGTGSGYQTAVLASLAKEVYTIERFAELSDKARDLFKQLGLDNVKVRVGDGTLGWPEEPPFERIIITAASPRLPLPLSSQLAEGGKVVFPQGEAFNQALTLIEKKDGKLIEKNICGCVFVPLVGKYGLKES